jgi:hypothetical protein
MALIEFYVDYLTFLFEISIVEILMVIVLGHVFAAA